MSERVILFGAGTTGRWIARNLKAQGKCPLCFVDNNPAKRETLMEELEVLEPQEAAEQFPDATFIASTIIPTFWREITAEIERLGVKTVPVWGFLPQRNTPPSQTVFYELLRLVNDPVSTELVWDQWRFRNDPANYVQCMYHDIADIYFPDFITHLDSEVFVDAGAGDGDTVKEFLNRWTKFKSVMAYEPDRENWAKMYKLFDNTPDIYGRLAAVTDMPGLKSFVETGDYSAHLGSEGK